MHAMRSQAPVEMLHREFWGQIEARGSVQAIRAQWPPGRHSRSGPQLVGVKGEPQLPWLQTSPAKHWASI